MSYKGFIKIHRQIIDSDIYQMPPLYLRVFERLLLEANHKDVTIPFREKGSSVVGKRLIKRGERLTSVRDICQWVSWYERGKKIVPNPKTIQSILDWLEDNNVIQIYGLKGNRTVTHYSIVNYNVYQSQTDDEVTVGKQKLDTNKNDKECKRNKYYIVEQVIDYLNQKTGRVFKSGTEATRSKIIARLEEGFVLDDFINVIDKKTDEWLDDADMQMYLRPTTLFGTKFEGYLNQKPVKNADSHGVQDGWEGIDFGTQL